MIIGIPRFTLFMQGHTKNWGSKSHVNQDYILLSSTINSGKIENCGNTKRGN